MPSSFLTRWKNSQCYLVFSFWWLRSTYSDPELGWQSVNKSDLVICPESTERQEEHFQIWQVIAVFHSAHVHPSEVDGPSVEYLRLAAITTLVKWLSFSKGNSLHKGIFLAQPQGLPCSAMPPELLSGMQGTYSTPTQSRSLALPLEGEHLAELQMDRMLLLPQRSGFLCTSLKKLTEHCSP